MRDKVSSLLGRLKLDYVILESEHNSGTTIIEKFIKNAENCLYAVVLFSADDIGKLENSESDLRYRVRQNVIFELGYFLGKIGRRNIVILHEANKNIETPSDFSGIVYEPFDEYGAWKSKLIREMRNANIYIKPELADRA
jgi:predicted nucleotide-binding protein